MKKTKKKKISQNPLTLNDLGEFTKDVLLPAVKNIVKDTVKEEIKTEIGKHRHDMKIYIDSKISENKGDIISYIKGDRERDKNWKIKVVNILKRGKLAKPQELKILIDLIR